jgi:lambda family phage portal protein
MSNLRDYKWSIDCLPGGSVESLGASVPDKKAVEQKAVGDNCSTEDWYRRTAFESAETDRLNEAHWSVVDDSPINDVLSYRLPIMRSRSNHEAWNNPTIKGLILSHTVAVVGDDSPLIDLQAEDEAGDKWCDEAEQVWEEWCRDSDAAGRVNLSTRIKRWNRSCWVNGEWIDQLVFPDNTRGSVRLRLHEIEPQRLTSPMDSIGDKAVILGIRRDQYRRPLEYFISDSVYGPQGGQWIRAVNIQHGWDEAMAEAGQARGVPWAQIGLPVAADLRDYDTQVLDAARGAADMALVAFTRHPDAEFFKDVPQTVKFQRRRINNLAPGWELGSAPANQPTATYKEHRQERQGDLGRAEGVPSMVTRLDARDHNYSSARFDYGLMHESAKHVRATLYNPKLFVLASLVLREAQLAGILRPAPERVWTDFVWTAMPQIDEEKSANAEEKLLKIGTLSYTEAVIERHGRRARDVIRRRARDARLLASEGLPSVAEATARNIPTQTPSE